MGLEYYFDYDREFETPVQFEDHADGKYLADAMWWLDPLCRKSRVPKFSSFECSWGTDYMIPEEDREFYETAKEPVYRPCKKLLASFDAVISILESEDAVANVQRMAKYSDANSEEINDILMFLRHERLRLAANADVGAKVRITGCM